MPWEPIVCCEVCGKENVPLRHDSELRRYEDYGNAVRTPLLICDECWADSKPGQFFWTCGGSRKVN